MNYEKDTNDVDFDMESLSRLRDEIDRPSKGPIKFFIRGLTLDVDLREVIRPVVCVPDRKGQDWRGKGKRKKRIYKCAKLNDTKLSFDL